MSGPIQNLMRDRHRLSVVLLLIVYLVGFTGTAFYDADALMRLTPANLIFVALLFFRNASSPPPKYLTWFLGIALAGYLVELAGIRTGLIFGAYQYGAGLGLKLAGVPLIIGLNWALLIFSTSALLLPVKAVVGIRAALGACLMVAYDLLLEPVAIRFDFWSWDLGLIPLQNYLAWWLVSFLMLLGILKSKLDLRNQMAGWILGVQALFFLYLILLQGLRIGS